MQEYNIEGYLLELFFSIIIECDQTKLEYTFPCLIII
jgi:hypothetical protein